MQDKYNASRSNSTAEQRKSRSIVRRAHYTVTQRPQRCSAFQDSPFKGLGVKQGAIAFLTLLHSYALAFNSQDTAESAFAKKPSHLFQSNPSLMNRSDRDA